MRNFVFSLISFVSLALLAAPTSVNHLIHREGRYAADELLMLTTRLDSEVPPPGADELRVYSLYEKIISEIRKKHSDKPIFFLGRDAEAVFDAYLSIATAEERGRIHLIELSRDMLKQPVSHIKNYLKKQGLNVQDLYEAKNSILFFDTGSRGTIYRKLLSHLVSEIPENSPNRKKSLKNLLNNFEGSLIVAFGSPNRDAIIERILSVDLTNQQIIDLIQSKYNFTEIPKHHRDDFNLDGADLDQRQWIVENIEHKVKWYARAVGITESGTIKRGANGGEVNKQHYIINQLKLVRYFKSRKYRLNKKADLKVFCADVF